MASLPTMVGEAGRDVSKPSLLPTGDATLVAGRYRLERLLGRGGMGSVHAAVEIATGKRIALKRLSAEADAKQLSLFEREYHTLSTLRHARIVEVYDYGTDEDGAFYTMELLEGADLSSHAPIAWRQVCRILRDIASVLGVLHARRLLHRDLSPRNVWVLRNGHIKLIDFGALTLFGKPTEIVGTPAFVPPEALRGQALDQRADLYALGALGYWLATGTHAYRANTVGELPRVWAGALVPPSRLAGLVKDAELDPIPATFDALIMSLLRQQAGERLPNTEVLIDRVNALVGAEPESHDATVQGYLASKAFVGRAWEREQVEDLLQRARSGEGKAVLIESASGCGRTRLLQELAVVGRLARATVLTADGLAGGRRYGIVSTLALHLLDLLPVEAARAAESHAAWLGHVSPELRARLSVAKLATTQDPAELRLRIQMALKQWFLAVCREQLLVFLLDDLPSFDDESATFLVALAHELKSHRALLVATAQSERATEPAPLVQRFGSQALRIRLSPLSAAETRELLSSVFGSTPYLQRFSERLYRFSEGNPAHCLELAEYLVRTGIVEYKEGLWVLPNELSVEQVPKHRSEAYAVRLQRVSPRAQKLAQVLSVQKGAFSYDRARSLSEEPHESQSSLAELTHEGVLVEVDQTYHFAHDSLRESLLSELDGARRARAHCRLGEAMLGTAQDPRDRIDAAIHLFRGGDHARGERLVREGVKYIVDIDLSGIGASVPALQEALELYREQGRDAYSLVHPLGLLAVAGYFVDRRLGARYGDAAIDTLNRLLHLDLARRLRPFLGGKVSLLVALTVALVTLTVRRPRAPSLVDAIRLLIGVASALSGMAACCIDPKSAARYAHAIEPLAALGADHAASFIYDFSKAIAQEAQDRPAETVLALRGLIERLESKKPIREMTENLRVNYLAGCLLPLGIHECWREGNEGLRIAGRLEAFGPLYEMSADYLRASYHESQGELSRAARYRERVEMHAIQLGSAWQMETWGPADATKVALRTHDAIVAKRAAQELSRLSLEVPSLELQARHARGTYCVLSGDYEAAIALLETDEEPASVVGWARTRGSLARAYNGLGNHEKAREVCLHAMSFLSPEDLAFSVMNLGVQVELAMAGAGLGHCDVARAQLDRLIASHRESQGPLTLGALHEARATIALKEADLEACKLHLAEMERWYRPTEIATLMERCESLAAKLRLAKWGRLSSSPEGLRDDALSRVQSALSTRGGSATERAQQALQIALDLSGVEDGFVILSRNGGTLVAHAGAVAPTAELMTWARRFLHASGEDEQTAALDAVDQAVDSSVILFGQKQYCLAPLWILEPGDRVVLLGAVALGFERQPASFPTADVLQALAQHLKQDLS